MLGCVFGFDRKDLMDQMKNKYVIKSISILIFIDLESPSDKFIDCYMDIHWLARTCIYQLFYKPELIIGLDQVAHEILRNQN